MSGQVITSIDNTITEDKSSGYKTEKGRYYLWHLASHLLAGKIIFGLSFRYFQN